MNDVLSKLEIDTIAEVGNISLGSSATALSNILGREVSISTPQVELLKVRDLKRYYPVPCLLAEIKYLSGLEGSNLLLIKEQDAVLIAAQMMQVPLEEAGPELGEMELSAIGEAMNQMMGYASTAMSEMFNRQIQISPPIVGRCDLADDNAQVDGLPDDAPVVQVSFRMQVKEILDSIIIQVIPLSFARKMASDLLGDAVVDSKKASEQDRESAHLETAAAGVPVNLKGPAVFESELLPEGEKGSKSDIDLNRFSEIEYLKEIPVEIEVVFGKKKIALGKLLELRQGSIIELENYAGEPVQVLVKNRLVARGEVVMINRQFGVRITGMETQASLSKTTF